MRIHPLLSALTLLLSLACTDKSVDKDDDSGQSIDADGDGYFETEDCDDTDATVNPGADELCADEIDNDCDGESDEDDASDASTWYADVDADGYGDPDTSTTACALPSGYLEDATDCDDSDDAQFPGADEYCNLEDDDCDGEVDESGALDESTWYLDADGDGYGDSEESTLGCELPSGYSANSIDCDDGAAHIHPYADEICDGEDTDCDPSTGEEGLVSLEDASGDFWDLSEEFNGSETDPAAPVLDSEDGTYWFCEGTHYIHARIETDIVLASLNGDPESTVLHGADSGTVLAVETDGIEVEVIDLGINHGLGNSEVDLGAGALGEGGGGIFCSGSSELSLDGVILSENQADIGAAIAAIGCEIELLSSFIENNSAATAGGIFASDADLSMSYTEVRGNSATDFTGAIYLLATTQDIDLDMTETLITENEGGTQGTIVALVSSDPGSIEASCYGSLSTEAGFLNNEAGSYGALSIISEDVTFESNSCDWGDEEGDDDNDPADIYIEGTSSSTGEETTFFYRIGDDYDIVCEDGRCGTETIYTLGADTGESEASTASRGNIIVSESTETLDDFSVYIDPLESCEVGLYVLSWNGAAAHWDIEFSAAQSLSEGAQWVSSGPIGMAVDEGETYALIYAWDCDLAYFYDVGAGSISLDGGFGSTSGLWRDNAYSTAYTGFVDDLSLTASDTRYYMTVTVSR
jgi:hypothetical protein